MMIVTRSAVAIALFLISWGIASADSDSIATGSPVRIAEATSAAPQEVIVAERKNAALDVFMLMRFENRTTEIYEPGASFIKLHFSRFNIPEGITVEVRSPDGLESYRYTREGREARTVNRKEGDDGRYGFSAMSINGDTAIVEVHGMLGHIKSLKNRVYIDYYMAGHPEDRVAGAAYGIAATNSTVETSGSKPSKTESVCGIDERYPAACWEGSNPTEFDRSWPVARLLIDGNKTCTAWRVGSGNFLFTNNHCVASQEQLETAEVWFNYQAIECNIYTLEETVKVAADSLFATHQALDFTLFSVHNFASIEPFGYLGLDVRDASLGERIYIPQHGYGSAKQIAIESDMNASGLCEVDDLNVDRYAPETDIGYFCDSVGGSSGSPVLADASNRAIALHHFGGCVNSGVKMSLIWPEVSGFFGGQVPAGDDENDASENMTPDARFSFACEATACSFNAGASADADGTVAEYTWSFGDGLTGVGNTVEHGYGEAGTYNVMLTVVDNEGASDSLTQTVTVEPDNQSPIAAFQVSCDGLACTFDSATSSDADGSIISYGWLFGDGTGALGVPVISHTYSAAGQYTVQLQVTDDDGATATVNTVLTVSESVLENQVPQASFTVSCEELTCDFDASDSFDPDGTIVSYRWDFGDRTGDTVGVPTVSNTFPTAGQYTVQLVVIDDDGARATVDTLVTINEPENQLPQASFTFSCQELACDFDARGSADPDGSILSYLWEFGDGATSSGDRVSHTFGAEGTYEVRLTVSDNREANSSATRTVQVTNTTTPAISLSAAAGKHRSDIWVDLEWDGVPGSAVDVYRNAGLLATTDNDGRYRDTTIKNSDKRIRYRVCEQDTANCSDEVLVSR